MLIDFKLAMLPRDINKVDDLDYSDSFALVANVVTVHILFVIASTGRQPLFLLDINNVFLHGFLDEDVYMLPPYGYTKASPGDEYLFKKSLYGLKQALCQWNY